MDPINHGFRIFDCHGHVPPVVPARADGSYDLDTDRAYRTGVLDKYGSRAAVLMASNLYERPNGVSDTRRMNDYVAYYRDHSQDRFPVGIGTCEPLFGAEAGVAEIRRIASELRLDGLVWHHLFQGSSMDDQRMVAFCKEAAGLGLPVFVHLNGDSAFESPVQLEGLAQKVPEVTIVAVGGMTEAQSIREMHGIADRRPNVLIEMSFLKPIGRHLERFVKDFGSERLIFGSDLTPYQWATVRYPPLSLVDILESDELTDKDRENILWNNAARLFPALKELR